MTHTVRIVAAALAIAAWFGAPAAAQHQQHGQAGDQDAHHHDMMTRGGRGFVGLLDQAFRGDAEPLVKPPDHLEGERPLAVEEERA